MPMLPEKNIQMKGNVYIKQYNEENKRNAVDTKTESSEIVVIQLMSFIWVLRFLSSNHCGNINVKQTSTSCKIYIYLYFPFMTKAPFCCICNTSFR